MDFQGGLDPHTPIGNGWLRASHRKLDADLSGDHRPYHSHDVGSLGTELNPMRGSGLFLHDNPWTAQATSFTTSTRSVTVETEAPTCCCRSSPRRRVATVALLAWIVRRDGFDTHEYCATSGKTAGMAWMAVLGWTPQEALMCSQTVVAAAKAAPFIYCHYDPSLLSHVRQLVSDGSPGGFGEQRLFEF